MDFIELYNQVIDENGKPMVCGREKCKELIRMCKELDNEHDYGNESNGMMMVDNIVKLRNSIK